MNIGSSKDLSCIIDLFMAERRGPCCLKPSEQVPAFFSSLFSQAMPTHDEYMNFRAFPLLAGFVERAEVLWAGESDGSIESDMWVETTPDGQDELLHAVATSAAGNNLLFVKRIDPSRVFNCKLLPHAHGLPTYRTATGDPLRDSQERYRKLFEKSADGFLMILSDGTILDANPSCLRLFGASKNEVLGASVTNFYWDPEDRKPFLAALETNGNVSNFEWRVRRKDGALRHCVAGATAWRDAEGELLAHITTVRDVTEIRETEELLRKSEEKYRTIVEGLEEGYYEMDFSGSIIFCNSSLARTLGLTVDEVIGLDYLKYTDPSYLGVVEETFERVRTTDQRAKILGWKLVNKDGVTLNIEASVALMKDARGVPVGFRGVCRDVSELKKAERERLLLVTAIEQSAESIMITDADEVVLYTNPAFERTTGYSSKEALGRKAGFIMSGEHGTESYRELRATLGQGQVWSGRFVNRKKDGELFHEEATISPVKDESGRIVSYVAAKRDVTREVRLEEELRQAQKMEAIGTLAGGVAHDFNNILSAIFGFTQLALDDATEGTRQHAALTEVTIAAERAAELVKQILTFSRKSAQEKRIVNIAVLVKEVLKFLRASLPSTIDIRPEIKAPGSQVMADPTQVHQVFMNLCTNAWHAMREKGGKLVAKIEDVVLDDRSRDLDGDMKPGPYLMLSVGDQGNGIPAHIRDRIFEPYFTTKKAGEGTGLGLAVVHGIVKSHGGSIRVDSEVGLGTTFRVFLPRVEEESMAKTSSPETIPTGNERILFVDDESQIVKLADIMLQDLGYTVISETDSLRALEVFQRDPLALDLIITDMTMPNMTGKELAAKVLAVRSDMPIILCTGFSEDIAPSEAKEQGISAFIMKPLNRDNLAPVVRDVLDNARRSTQ